MKVFFYFFFNFSFFLFEKNPQEKPKKTPNDPNPAKNIQGVYIKNCSPQRECGSNHTEILGQMKSSWARQRAAWAKHQPSDPELWEGECNKAKAEPSELLSGQVLCLKDTSWVI